VRAYNWWGSREGEAFLVIAALVFCRFAQQARLQQAPHSRARLEALHDGDRMAKVVVSILLFRSFICFQVHHFDRFRHPPIQRSRM
jgi:hypothetical protein